MSDERFSGLAEAHLCGRLLPGGGVVENVCLTLVSADGCEHDTGVCLELSYVPRVGESVVLGVGGDVFTVEDIIHCFHAANGLQRHQIEVVAREAKP